MVAIKVALITWNMNIHMIVRADVALDGLRLYCQEVIVAANCINMIPIKPAKISVRRLK